MIARDLIYVRAESQLGLPTIGGFSATGHFTCVRRPSLGSELRRSRCPAARWPLVSAPGAQTAPT